jgi:hypothetical protein
MLLNLSDWSGLNNEPLVIKSMYVCCMILISFGNSWPIFKSGNTLGCVNGLENSSNDNAWGMVLMPNFGVSFGVGVAVALGIAFTSVWAVDDGAELAGVGTDEPSVVVWLLGAVVWGAIALGVGVVNTLVGFNGLTGETGLVMFVGLVSDFVQVLDVVTHVPLHVGCE